MQVKPEQTSSDKTKQNYAVLAIEQDAGHTNLILEGVWRIHTIGAVEAQISNIFAKASGTLHLIIDGIHSLDTAGALLINELIAKAKKQNLHINFAPQNQIHQKLLKISQINNGELPKAKVAPNLLVAVLNQCGQTVCEQVKGFGQLIGIIGKYWISFFKGIFGKRKLRWTSLSYHIEQVGLRAVPIVALLTFLIGMVVAYMGSEALAQFGGQIFAVNLLEVTVLREMGVLITSIVVAGRSSSSFTAQIGSMVANEEVAAMSAMGLDPSEVLVTPRVTALLISLPVLVFIANIMALAGGGLAMWLSIDLHPTIFLVRLQEVASFENFFVGMVKTPFFAIVIGLVGCLQGFRAKGDSASVGFLTTVAVVQSIFLVIVLDAFFAIFFTALGV